MEEEATSEHVLLPIGCPGLLSSFNAEDMGLRVYRTRERTPRQCRRLYTEEAERRSNPAASSRAKEHPAAFRTLFGRDIKAKPLEKGAAPKSREIPITGLYPQPGS
ncbi:uncharacterized protein LOC143827143 [Paroedura picta]|uniref:uncharacterized protein LOC143827143 n=1 Tax=Paroedura picta TaxID=143630 RepID=UPI004055D580